MKSTLTVLLFSLFLGVCTDSAAQDRFSQYVKVPIFEVRPGTWAIPLYNSKNQICEIGLQHLFYSPTSSVAVNPELSPQEIFSILDDLVPLAERGLRGREIDDAIIVDGGVMSRSYGYEKVTLDIFQASSPNGKRKNLKASPVAAVITWKTRSCKE